MQVTDEKVVLSEEEEDESPFIHLVHRCHDEAEFVTAMCGFILDWDEKRDGSDKDTCPLCEAAMKCPVCGRYRIRGV